MKLLLQRIPPVRVILHLTIMYTCPAGIYATHLSQRFPFPLFTFASPVDAYESAQQITTSLRSLRLCPEAASVDAAEADAAKEDPATAAASPTAQCESLLPIAYCLLPMPVIS